MRHVPNKNSTEKEERPKIKRKNSRYDEKLDIVNKLNTGLTRGHVSQQTGVPYHTFAQIQRRQSSILALGLVMSNDIRQKKYCERNQLLT